MRKKVCPNCGSENIQNNSSLISAVGLDYRYECQECGYEGKLFPEVEKERLGEYQESLEPEDSAVKIREKKPKKSRILLGAGITVLSLGSLAYALKDPQGIWGALLIIPGIKLVYEEFEKF
ncbi:MAG: hypothetical protein MUP58_00765 [Candidatus Nanohaloarchaeota archaeon QJJ-9]|nr:hypothetical protein [Candidatus Nanohaloarchaeota archaeon QJJ-9]